MKSLSSALVLATIATLTVAQKCYSADGQQLDSRYQPCYPEAENSACCMLNGTQGDAQQNDICLDSGLCQSTSGWYAGFLYINGCTDQTGQADRCAKICSFLGNQYSWNVLQCAPGKFCCRASSDTDNCCNNNQSMISTSHIGSLLLPGSTSVVNTTYNATAESSTSSSSNNNTCAASTSSNSNLIDRSQCPADKSAAVGGAVGGVLGAALIGAVIALVFALRSRKQNKVKLGATETNLTAMETRAAEEKANHQKQLEEQQRHIQTMPPNYANPQHSQNRSHPTRPALPNEMDSNGSHGYSELGGGDGSRVELTGETARL